MGPSGVPAPTPGSGTRDHRVLDGPWRAEVADEELRRLATDPDFDDSAWAPIPVPCHWRTRPAFAGTDGPLLHRHRFSGDRPGADERRWLVFDGIFYTSDIWLDGTYLGDTEGYFFPHAFEVTDALRDRDDHVLTVEVACRPEADRAHKRNLTGVFQHWDLLDPDANPGGLWRPVRVERSGPVRIAHLRVLCRDATAEAATVFVRTVLDSVEAHAVEIVTTVVPDDDPSGGVEHRQVRPLAAGENRVEWSVTVPDPRRWWPRVLGDQPRYTVTVEVHADEPAGAGRWTGASDAQARSIGLRSVAMDNWIVSINGERLFLKGSNLGPTAADLAGVTAAEVRRDVDLAVQANLDFLRVHGHVARPELYDAADEAGLLLWQDMPLQWGYHRSVRKQGRRQARELVDLLAHHPSVFLWCGHNEPMAIDVGPEAWATPAKRRTLLLEMTAAQLLPTWNKTVLDGSIRRVLERTDGSRPVVAHSGVLPNLASVGTDAHLYFGWYHGDERELPGALRLWPRLASFLSEFGAQAVPEDASFLEPERWPDLDWDGARDHRSLQRHYLERVVPSDGCATFDEWRAATQAYQAELIRRHIETLRRLKYRPAGGFAHFCFADPRPAVTWSVLGHDRAPKAAYPALRDACAPVIVVADRLPATVAPGAPIELDIHVVSDARISFPDMVTTAHLHWEEGGGDAPVVGPHPTGDEQRWSWHGEIPPDDCVRVGTIRTTAPTTPGRLVLDLVLTGPDGTVATNHDVTEVADLPRRPRRRRDA